MFTLLLRMISLMKMMKCKVQMISNKKINKIKELYMPTQIRMKKLNSS